MFATVIHSIVHELDNDRGRRFSPQLLAKRHSINRRRLYDLTNIVTVVGCATGTVDDLTWNGLNMILPRVLHEKQEAHIDNYQLPLSVLFPPDKGVGFASLTTALLMIFPAIGTEVLNPHDVSAFLSRATRRYKTTLCQLYQITLILCTLAVTERTSTSCEVQLRAPFTLLLEDMTNPMAIENLVNRPSTGAEFRQRREEFYAVSKKHI
jgi:hypothetical protein